MSGVYRAAARRRIADAPVRKPDLRRRKHADSQPAFDPRARPQVTTLSAGQFAIEYLEAHADPDR